MNPPPGPLLVEDDGPLRVLTLYRPEKRNALNDRLVRELKAGFARAEADADVRVVVLRAAGDDFCAGADLSQLERIAQESGPLENLEDASSLADLFVSIRHLSKPVVAVVQGHALAGGAGLATACDVVLAAEDAAFGYPEVHLGFVPAMVMALLRRAVGEKVAFELVAQGDRIPAAEAHRLGLVTRLYPPGILWEESLAYARGLAARPPSALRLIKRLLYGMDGMSFEQAIARGAEVNVLARLTSETKSGVRRFLDRSRGS